jgi:hypothetical protein
MADDAPYFERLARVTVACGDVPPREQLDLLTAAWLVVASGARNAALMEPGGFPAERARQVTLLRRLADLIVADVPDLEMERLWQEGDMEGFRRYVQSRLSDPPPDA